MKINVPDGWHQVTLGQFIEIGSLDPKSANHALMVASILTDVDSEEIKKYDTESFNRIVNALSWSNALPEEGGFKKVIEIDGVEYGLINRLSELSVGNWMDLEEYLKDFPQNIHKVLSILYRPLITALNDDFRIIEEYESISGANRAEVFYDKMSVADVHGAVLFFCLIGNLSIKNMKTYLENQIFQMNQKKELKPKSIINGVGSILFTPWQRGILRKLNRSLN